MFSYEALRTRLEDSRLLKNGLQDMYGPVIKLSQLRNEEIFVLLKKISDIHAAYYGYNYRYKDDELGDFLQEVVNHLGARELLTPREIVKDFITMLNILHQNKGMTVSQYIHGADFKPTKPVADPDAVTEDSKFAEFSL